MTGKELKVTAALAKKLADIANSMGRGSVSVGFLENAKYPDGTPVAAVAFWNEFGKERPVGEVNEETGQPVEMQESQPPRPFFRNMISKESPGWPRKMAALAKASNYDGKEVLGTMGEDIEGALKESINNLTSPKLAESTIKRKGFDKPLIDTSHMINSVDSEVNS